MAAHHLEGNFALEGGGKRRRLYCQHSVVVSLLSERSGKVVEMIEGWSCEY